MKWIKLHKIDIATWPRLGSKVLVNLYPSGEDQKDLITIGRMRKGPLGYMFNCGGDSYYMFSTVLAWMPLP